MGYGYLLPAVPLNVNQLIPHDWHGRMDTRWHPPHAHSLPRRKSSTRADGARLRLQEQLTVRAHLQLQLPDVAVPIGIRWEGSARWGANRRRGRLTGARVWQGEGKREVAREGERGGRGAALSSEHGRFRGFRFRRLQTGRGPEDDQQHQPCLRGLYCRAIRLGQSVPQLVVFFKKIVWL